MNDEEWPVYRAVVKSFGTDRFRSLSLLRETLGVGPAEARALMDTRGVEVACGPQLSPVKEVASRFRAAGARVRVEVVGAPERVSVQHALQLHASFAQPKPLSVEGCLIVTGLFSYLAPDRDSPEGILVSGPELERRLDRRKAPAQAGGVIGYEGPAVVEGLLYSATLPMFPVSLTPVVVTYSPPGWKPIRLEFF